MLEHNNGLLFWGNVGTGKTFAAACIANALIDNGVPALVPDLSFLYQASKNGIGPAHKLPSISPGS